MTTRKGISAAQFMATLSTAGREERKPIQRPSGHPESLIQERWIDGKWESRKLVWNGEMYAEAK